MREKTRITKKSMHTVHYTKQCVHYKVAHTVDYRIQCTIECKIECIVEGRTCSERASIRIFHEQHFRRQSPFDKYMD
jgi:hypothetical protein